MTWIKENGRIVKFTVNKYVINWNKKAPSKGAQTVQDFLRKHAGHYLWLAEFRIPGTKLRCDYLCPPRLLVVEFDGKQHMEYNPHFHRNKMGFLNSLRRDERKERLLERNGYKVIRIDDDVLNTGLTKKWFEETYGVIL